MYKYIIFIIFYLIVLTAAVLKLVFILRQMRKENKDFKEKLKTAEDDYYRSKHNLTINGYKRVV